MVDWLLNLPVLWMGVVILGAIYAFTAGLYLTITALAVGERARAFKAISPGILPPLSVIFALLTAFLASQDWGDAEKAAAAVNREASALRAVDLLGDAFPDDVNARLADLIRRYIEDAVNQEWPAMARGSATLTLAPPRMVEALKLVLSLQPATPGQMAAQREMVTALGNGLDARRQRIILSRSSINGVKWSALLVEAALTLIAIAMVHSDNRLANRIVLTIFATGVGVAIVLVASHSHPFSGQISLRPTVLLQVVPEAHGDRAAPGSR
jgi:hypothetical protein